MKQFQPNDRVRLKGTEYVGTITIALEKESKVLFDNMDAPDYWYYPNEDLESETKEDETNL